MPVLNSVAVSRRVAASASTAVKRHFSSTARTALAGKDPASFATQCAHLYQPAAGAAAGLATPVYFGSTYTLQDADHGARLHAKKEAPYADGDGYVYSRWGTPTNEAAARQIAALEGVEYGNESGGTLLFNSGMSGITSSLMAVLKAGDHAVFPYCVYGGTHEFLKEFAVFWNIEVDFVDPSDVSNYEAALRDNTKVVYCETPANPTCRLTDLEAVGKVVDARYGTRADNPNAADGGRPWVMVDGTFATPYHQRSLDAAGIDVAIQSATKYLGGHSDLLAGSVTSRSAAFLHEVSKVQKLITAPLNPMDSFLLARGVRTLDVRMQRHGENALRVARMLEDHPMVKQVFYPGLPSHPDYELAKRTFRSGRDEDADDADAADTDAMPQTFGGMIAFIVDGDDDTALRRAKTVCEGLSVINLAVSLGGVESLVEHPASMTHAMIPREDRLAGGLPDGLVRISVGLERASDLVQDLKGSLDRCDDDVAGAGGGNHEERVYVAAAQ